MICDCPVGSVIYVLGEGIISIRVQGGSFIVDVISRGVHLLTGVAHRMLQTYGTNRAMWHVLKCFMSCLKRLVAFQFIMKSNQAVYLIFDPQS